MLGLGLSIGDLAKRAGAAVIGSLKKTQLVDANNFYINSPLPGVAKALALSFVLNNGSNDAGANHLVWRKGPHYYVDTVDVNANSGGYKTIAQSNGAQDYALSLENAGGDIFGGSYHGGETVRTTMKWYCDGVEFTPTAGQAIGRKFEMVRGSRITWSTGATADIDYTFKIEEDNVTEQSFTVTTSAELSSPANYATLAFVDPRFTRIISEGSTTNMVSLTNYELGTTTRSVKLMDPVTGDYVVFDFTVTGKTVDRVYVAFNANYSKLYVQTPGGVGAAYSVTQRATYYVAPVDAGPTLPYTDTFSGSALGALWKNIVAGGASSVVSGGDWVITNNAVNTIWVHPLFYPPGNYRVRINYQTDTANTCLQAAIARADTVSSTNFLVAATSLNSLSAVDLDLTFTITEGMTPWLRMIANTSNGRIARIHSITVTQV